MDRLPTSPREIVFFNIKIRNVSYILPGDEVVTVVSFTLNELAFIWEELEEASKKKGIYGRTATDIRNKIRKANPKAAMR